MEHKKKILYGITSTTMSIFCCYMITYILWPFPCINTRLSKYSFNTNTIDTPFSNYQMKKII